MSAVVVVRVVPEIEPVNLETSFNTKVSSLVNVVTGA
jgi:hypothetical protein